MTTLARLYINPQKRGARKLLTNAQAMHAAVRAAYPPDLADEGRVLWRVDASNHAHTLYIVGPEQPDLDHIVEQAGWSTRPGDVADYSPLLDSLRKGQEWSFRLVANPVKSIAGERGTRGKRKPHVTVEHQTRWLIDRAAGAGFAIRGAPAEAEGIEGAEVAVTARQNLSFPRIDAAGRARTVSLRTARFDGSLRVTDVDAMRTTLTQGVGRARAYGCGLLTLARLGS